MTWTLRHRGPDACGVFVDGPAGLAHTRLSIIDLSGGAQPMTDAEGRMTITYNGEVFNYVELRAELEARGRRFVTSSDTEVVLQAWQEWGEAALSKFDGQFAFAIWDQRTRKLVLARDRLGVRPIYTCIHGGRLYFASEVKAIFAADASIPRELDTRSLNETFTFWTVVAPRSVFTGVEELRPGHVRTYDLAAEKMRESRYAALSFPARGERRFRGNADDAAEAVREALERAVRLRMLRADVPVGAYLSGGLDSSLVAALAARATPRFSTFSIRFEDAEYDEGDYQAMMSRALGTEHHELVAKRSDVAATLFDTVYHAERPLLRTAPVPLLLLSRLVRGAGIKVVVTGEGADEMFAGYDLFREAKVRRFWARQPTSSFRPKLLSRLYPWLARSPLAQQAMAEKFFGRDLELALTPGFAHGPRWSNGRALGRLFAADRRSAAQDSDPIADLLAAAPAELGSWTSLAQDQFFEIATLLSGYLLSSQGDRVAMASSVEGRFPFLDVDVVELACALPDEHKLRVLDEKHVLKRVARGLIPDAIADRKKQPYRAPDALALADAKGREHIERFVAPDAVKRAGIFDPEMVSRLWEKCKERASSGQLSNADNMALVAVASTQMLHEAFVETSPAEEARRATAASESIGVEGSEVRA